MSDNEVHTPVPAPAPTETHETIIERSSPKPSFEKNVKLMMQCLIASSLIAAILYRWLISSTADSRQPNWIDLAFVSWIGIVIGYYFGAVNGGIDELKKKIESKQDKPGVNSTDYTS